MLKLLHDAHSHDPARSRAEERLVYVHMCTHPRNKSTPESS